METIRKDIPNHFSLPRRISRLADLTYNLWWVWNPDAQRLFSQIDKELWERIYHNPVAFLRQVERPKLNAVTYDRYYLEAYDRVLRNFDAYMKAEDTWFKQNFPDRVGQEIAYFSFEFGLHESLPVYAGGLGVLSGDHLKGASDLGLPLFAIGFLYTQGYFSQKITEDGWQEARPIHFQFEELPIIPLMTSDGQTVTISVSLPGREVSARIWMIQVGRVPLYLLDTNVEQNNTADRLLTARLYNSDPEMRISQEIILGVGGVRAVRALNHNPAVWHMNEGHSAFLTLERIRELVSSGMSFEQASEKVRASNVFTTHTPVPAGNDMFPLWLIDKYFSQIWTELGMTRDQFIDLGGQGLILFLEVLDIFLETQQVFFGITGPTGRRRGENRGCLFRSRTWAFLDFGFSDWLIS